MGILLLAVAVFVITFITMKVIVREAVADEVRHKTGANGVRYVGFRHTLMCDWDLPDVGHKTEECLTIASRSEALGRLEAWTKAHPGFKFRVYETPGGVRAWCLSHPIEAGSALALQVHQELGCDPVYTRLSAQNKRFWARVSPKPEREGDYVCRVVGMVGEGPTHPQCGENVARHDVSCGL